MVADSLVKAGFFRRKRQAKCIGLARRQLDMNLVARVAYHYIAEQFAQLTTVFGQARVAAYAQTACGTRAAFSAVLA